MLSPPSAMTERKSLRDRGRISYEEYSDDGFDSPVKKQRKIVSSDSDEGPEDAAPQKHGILKFARKGVDNTKLPDAGSSPPAKRKQTAASRRMKRNHK